MNIITTEQRFLASKTELNTYIARPDTPHPLPTVIVIHEAYGLNDNIKDIANRFANEGFVAIAVDLFEGRNRVICMARFFYGMLRNSLGHFGILDLKATLTYFSNQPYVDASRVGAVGYCLGGGLAIAWSCADERLSAIAPYYGFNPNPLNLVERACAVVGSYPAEDFTAKAAVNLDAMLETYHVPHDIKVYEGAKHSFFNDQGANYNANAAQDSWERTLQFFKTHIVEKATD